MLKKLLFVLNADWYFDLHWIERAINAQGNGYCVTVALPQCSKTIKNKIESQGMRVVTFPMKRTSLGLLGELRSIFQLKSIVKDINPDIIHSITIKPNLYCSIICSLFSIPLVCTYPGLGTLRVSSKLSHRFFRFLVFNIISFFSKKIRSRSLFENEDDILFFKENHYLDDEKIIRVFGAGVDINKFDFVENTHDSSKLRILFASRLLKNKGLELLVSACERLKNVRNINIELSVAGIIDSDSPFSFSSQEINEISNKSFVNWLGCRNDIPYLIACNDIVALPTEYGEGIPRILIEACSIGRPIITTSLGGCRDICLDGVTGYLVKSGDELSLCDAIEEFYKHPYRKNEMGLKARKIVEEKFSNDFIFSQNLYIYQELL